jgi:hypothetical protein
VLFDSFEVVVDPAADELTENGQEEAQDNEDGKGQTSQGVATLKCQSTYFSGCPCFVRFDHVASIIVNADVSG